MGAARVVAVPSDAAAASRQELAAELNGVRSLHRAPSSGDGDDDDRGDGWGSTHPGSTFDDGGGHATLEVYAAPGAGMSPRDAVVGQCKLKPFESS